MSKNNIKNLKLGKKALTLFLTSTLALALSSCAKKDEKEVSIAPVNSYIMQNDYVRSTVSVNMRTDNDFSGEIICKIKPNEELKRILSCENNWHLVIYKNRLGFVCGDFIVEDDKTKTEEKDKDSFEVLSEDGYVSADSKVNLRIGPSMDDKVIGSLKTGEFAKVLGKVDSTWYLIIDNDKIAFVSADYTTYKDNISFDKVENDKNDDKTYVYSTVNVNFREEPNVDSNKLDLIKKETRLEVLSQEENGWFKIIYNGQIGYVCNDYVTYHSNDEYRRDFTKVVYAKEDIELKTQYIEDSDSIYYIDKGETCEVLNEDEKWYFVRCAGKTGYIRKETVEPLFNDFIVIDIEEQKLTLYHNNSIILETDIVTGEKGINDTPTGIYSIGKKETNTYLSGDDYFVNIDYWMPFNRGIGLHDASWRKNFGGAIYEYDGSHGCVNVPPNYMDDIYDNVDIGSKVLVHK